MIKRTRGNMRRGREVHQLDIGYPESSLALEQPVRLRGLLAGDRAPNAPIKGAAGQSVRRFELFKGTHWTLLGYEAQRDAYHRVFDFISTPSVHTAIFSTMATRPTHLRPAIGRWCVRTATLAQSLHPATPRRWNVI